MKPDAKPTPQDPHADEDGHIWVSALADGDAQATDRACTLWRHDEGARAAWHAYHLIGDVMRSDELAAPPAHDSAFLVALRERLRAEPVVLAPPPPRKRQPWLVPAAVTAGFVAVAAALVLARSGGPAWTGGGAGMASASSAPAVALVPGRQLVSNQDVMRDARLDEFLRAHQAAGGGVAVAAPGGTLRRVDVIVPVGSDR